MPVLSMPVLSMPVLSMPVLSMPVLSMPVLSMSALSMSAGAERTCDHAPWASARVQHVAGGWWWTRSRLMINHAAALASG
jgi:hypothetical protein